MCYARHSVDRGKQEFNNHIIYPRMYQHHFWVQMCLPAVGWRDPQRCNPALPYGQRGWVPQSESDAAPSRGRGTTPKGSSDRHLASPGADFQR